MLMVLLLFVHNFNLKGHGYEFEGAQGTCGRPYRSGRIYLPPCDMKNLGFCNTPGNTYPWHAMKRFVRDNQGLMKRMYGDQRHSHVLKSELREDVHLWKSEDDLLLPSKYFYYEDDNNWLEENSLDIEKNEARLFSENAPNEDVLNTKFIFADDPDLSVKLSTMKTKHSNKHISQNVTDLPNETIRVTTESYTNSVTTEDVFTTTNLHQRDTFTNVSPTEGENYDKNDKGQETVLFQDTNREESKIKRPLHYNVKGVNACPVKEEVVAPFWANNTRGETLALLNMYPFEQYVHWEKCTFELRKMYCKEGCRCEQQYRLHRLLAYDPNNECKGIFSDWFRFPSCCVCKCYDIPPSFRITSRSPRNYNKNY